MYTLPNDMIILIFDSMKLITDKRQFVRTCSRYNNLTKKSMEFYDENYAKQIYKQMFKYGMVDVTKNCMDKFTLELSHDKYFNMIPRRYITSTNSVIVTASAYFGNIKLLDKLKNTYIAPKLDDTMCELAAKNGQLDVLKWANGCDVSEKLCNNAAKRGHFDVLKWLYINNRLRTYVLCEYVAKGGHLPILIWCHALNLDEYDSGGICSEAAKYGHLHVLKWAHENGCFWNSNTCANAAERGQLECLKYARENGCAWDYRIYSNARKHGHTELLKWAIENGCSTNLSK